MPMREMLTGAIVLGAMLISFFAITAAPSAPEATLQQPAETQTVTVQEQTPQAAAPSVQDIAPPSELPEPVFYHAQPPYSSSPCGSH
ncbi:MAG: hypothetical protein ACREJB_08250 [Planctomycetaceae bacterium]